jgi:hypothetical protein
VAVSDDPVEIEEGIVLNQLGAGIVVAGGTF